MLPKSIKKSVKKQAERLLEQGRKFNRFEQIRQRHFWSTHLFKPDPATGYISSGTFQLFTTPAGQSGQGYASALTGLETNWKGANRVTDNQNIEITEVGVSCWSVPKLPNDDLVESGDVLPPSQWMLDPASAAAFVNSTVLSITYLTNQVELGMCADFAQPSAPYIGIYEPMTELNGASAGDGIRNATQRQNYSSNGFPAPGLRRKWKIPILLQHGETFSFTYTIPRPFFVLPFERATAAGIDPDPPAIARYIAARMDFWGTESFVEKS